jgi:hypothetical protein
MYVNNNPITRYDPYGTQDKEALRIADTLQEHATDLDMRMLPRETLQQYGTRLHGIFQKIIESAPGGVQGRIVTELVFDETGRIYRFGGSPSEASAYAKKLGKHGIKVATVDAGILKPGIKATPDLAGKKIQDVLLIGVDYKTGEKGLEARQKRFFKKLGVPLEKLKSGGNLVSRVREALHSLKVPRERTNGTTGGTPKGGSGSKIFKVAGKLLRGLAVVGNAIDIGHDVRDIVVERYPEYLPEGKRFELNRTDQPGDPLPGFFTRPTGITVERQNGKTIYRDKDGNEIPQLEVDIIMDWTKS